MFSGSYGYDPFKDEYEYIINNAGDIKLEGKKYTYASRILTFLITYKDRKEIDFKKIQDIILSGDDIDIYFMFCRTHVNHIDPILFRDKILKFKNLRKDKKARVEEFLLEIPGVRCKEIYDRLAILEVMES